MRVGMEKGDVFVEESFKFGEILGPGKGENWDIFSRRMPLAWAIFWGIGRGKTERRVSKKSP